MTNKRRSISKTPKRKSERKRKRTSKGTYYDENFDSVSDGSTHDTVAKTILLCQLNR